MNTPNNEGRAREIEAATPFYSPAAHARNWSVV
jgi:hypothetical protein